MQKTRKRRHPNRKYSAIDEMEDGKQNVILMPCPFCGEENMIDVLPQQSSAGEWLMVKCGMCRAYKEVMSEYLAQVEVEWNRRPGKIWDSRNKCYIIKNKIKLHDLVDEAVKNGLFVEIKQSGGTFQLAKYNLNIDGLIDVHELTRMALLEEELPEPKKTLYYYSQMSMDVYWWAKAMDNSPILYSYILGHMNAGN